MKDGVAWAWIVSTVSVLKLLKVTCQKDASEGWIRQETMRYKPIRTKSAHPIKHIYIPNEDNLSPYRGCNDMLSDSAVLMLWFSIITQIKISLKLHDYTCKKHMMGRVYGL